MEKIAFNTEYINKEQTSLNDIMCELRQLMIDDIHTAVDNTENLEIVFDEPVYLPYSDEDTCWGVWDEEGELCFGFSSPKKRFVEDVGFELLNHVYNTLQNEGYFNSKNYSI